MSIAAYVYRDPLLLGLVVLNVVPLIILGLVHVFRALWGTDKQNVHLVTPNDPLLWNLLQNKKEAGLIRPVMFITGSNVGPRPVPDSLSAQVVDLGKKEVEDVASVGKPEEEVVVKKEEMFTAVLTAAGRLAKMEAEKLGRTFSPVSPFDFDTGLDESDAE